MEGSNWLLVSRKIGVELLSGFDSCIEEGFVKAVDLLLLSSSSTTDQSRVLSSPNVLIDGQS